MVRPRWSIVALLAVLSCREGAVPLPLAETPRDAGTADLPDAGTAESPDAGTPEPRDTVGVDPNPAPSPLVVARVVDVPDNLRGWPAGEASWSVTPEDPAAHGLSVAITTQVLSAEPGGPLLYEVADERSAVLFRRDLDGTVQALRTSALSAPRRTVAADGRFEAWWDRGLWVLDLESSGEPRRYAVPEALDTVPQVVPWGMHDLAALVATEEGWQVYRVQAEGPPVDLGVVGTLEDGVFSGAERLLVRHDASVTSIGVAGERLTLPLDAYYAHYTHGTAALFVRYDQNATWIDFETGLTRTFEGEVDDALVAQYVSHDGHFVLKKRDGTLGVVNMRTGEVRWVPGAVVDEGLYVYGAAADARRLVLTQGALQVFDVESGALVHEWPDLWGYSAAVLDEGKVTLQDVDEVRRVALDSGEVEVVPGILRGLWGEVGLLSPASFGEELWLVALGSAPRQVLASGDRQAWWATRLTTTPLRFLLASYPRYPDPVELTVVDAELGPIWSLEAGFDATRTSGERLWLHDREADTMSFLDLDTSPPVLRSAVLDASGVWSWPARSSLVAEVGADLVEVFADGSEVSTRILGQYTVAGALGEDLWASRGGGLYRFDSDGQASLRYHVPEGAWVRLPLVTETRAIVRATVDDVDHYYSVAVRGPQDGFELSAAAVAGGVYPHHQLDAQGRILRVEEGRLVAYGASETPEVLLAPAGDEVRGASVEGGEWLALTQGAGGVQLWWTESAEVQHLQVSAVSMRSYFHSLGEGLVVVSTALGQQVIDLPARRATRVPRDANGYWDRLDEGRLIGGVYGRAGLWVWNMGNNTLTPMLHRGMSRPSADEILPWR